MSAMAAVPEIDKETGEITEERQLALFEGHHIFGNDVKIKAAADALVWNSERDEDGDPMLFREELAYGSKVKITASAQVVGVYFERDKHGLLRRKHIIEIAEATLEV